MSINYSIMPMVGLEAVSNVMQSGSRKHGARGFDDPTAVDCKEMIAKARGHIEQFENGSDPDTESGESHLAHAAADLMIIVERLKLDRLGCK